MSSGSSSVLNRKIRARKAAQKQKRERESEAQTEAAVEAQRQTQTQSASHTQTTADEIGQLQRKETTSSNGHTGTSSDSLSLSDVRANLPAARDWFRGVTAKELLSDQMFSSSALKAFHSDWHERCTAAGAPFPYVRIENFLSHTFAVGIRDELLDMEYSLRSNDLFEFYQSDDLKSANEDEKPLTCKLRDILYGQEFRQSVEEISGLAVSGLSHSVSISAAIYGRGHYLLPHDDRLEGRRLAYILYFNAEDWSEEDGGQLDFFSVNDVNEPTTRPAISLLPKFNSLVCFPVSNKSWHQVREVLRDENKPKKTTDNESEKATSVAKSKKASRGGKKGRGSTADNLRLSISGWFHAPLPNSGDADEMTDKHSTSRQKKARKGKDTETKSDMSAAHDTLRDDDRLFVQISDTPTTANKTDNDLLDWLSRDYRKPAVQKTLQKQFAAESVIQLHQFLRGDIYANIIAQLNDTNNTNANTNTQHWTLHGPPSRRLRSQWSDVQPHNSMTSSHLPVSPPLAQSSSSSLLFSSAAANVPVSDSVRRVNDLLRLFRSGAFAGWLSCVTGLSYVSCSAALYRYHSTCYSLTQDRSTAEVHSEALDLSFSLLDSQCKWRDDFGGSVHWVQENDAETLVSATPKANVLTIIYRAGSSAAHSQTADSAVTAASSSSSSGSVGTSGVFKFVKYVTQQAPQPRFELDAIYRVKEEEEEHTEQNDSEDDESEDNDDEEDGDNEDEHQENRMDEDEDKAGKSSKK